MGGAKVISTSTVQAASHNVNEYCSTPGVELTPWDLQLLLVDPIQKGLLFHNPKTLSQHIQHLKVSLSRTLDFFPPLSGRLATIHHDDNTTSFFINCNNAGALFVHAKAYGVTVSDINESGYVPQEKLRKFLECWVQEPKLLTEGNMAANALVTSSSPRFDVYGNDFGWGRPVGVRSGAGNKSHGKITVFSGVEEGSIDIEACLLAETLEAMGNDSEFMDAVTV
ncbi:unnamed protein product [Malus baccata var. baccata]